MNTLQLKEIRNNLGITQSEMAERLGITMKTIQNYEKGFPIPLSVQKLIQFEFLPDTKTDINHKELPEKKASGLTCDCSRELNRIITHFEDQIRDKERLIEEKERLIQLLLCNTGK